MMSLRLVVIGASLCLLVAAGVDGGTEAEIIKALEETQQEVAWKYIPLSGPSIDETNSKNVTAQVGKTAVLNCRIKYLGGKTVSWMRGRDLHLLTVGRFTYTSDDRFRAVHQSGSDDWLLKIHYAQHRDAGAYECQVSTTPPLSKTVWLTVVETRVLGGPDLHINSGSTINLTCVVQRSPEPPPYIFWYHEDELLSYDSPRGGITVVTEHGPTSTSRLLIQKATLSDAGRYTCRPANAEPHFLTVHIIHNEHPAAIHHKNGTSSGPSLHQQGSSSHSLILMLLMLVLIAACSALPSENYNACQVLRGDDEEVANASKVKEKRPSHDSLGLRVRSFVMYRDHSDTTIDAARCSSFSDGVLDNHSRHIRTSCGIATMVHAVRRNGDLRQSMYPLTSSSESSCSHGKFSCGHTSHDSPIKDPHCHRRPKNAFNDHQIPFGVTSDHMALSETPSVLVVSCQRRMRSQESSRRIGSSFGVSASHDYTRRSVFCPKARRGKTFSPVRQGNVCDSSSPLWSA